VLPPDARFCHKCGKPQGEEPRAEEPVESAGLLPGENAAPAPAPAQPHAGQAGPDAAPPAALPIGFHNAVAVRIGLVIAAITFGLLLIPLPAPLAILRLIVGPLAAGFVSVYLYHRRTGQPISVLGGAQMGWITGLFCFVIATVLFTFSVLVLSQPDVVDFLRKQGQNSADLDRMLEGMRQAQESIPLFLISTLMLMFGIFTFIPMLGGVLGAKVLEKD
jgi:hypothetical protein